MNHTYEQIQEVIDEVNALTRKAQDDLDALYIMAGKWVGESTARSMSRRELKLKHIIRANDIALSYLYSQQSKLIPAES
jgi:hypothetical protein